MEYYIFVTHDCNMQCKYCSAHNVTFSNKSSRTITKRKIKEIAEYINRHMTAQNSSNGKNRIVFFGGEPLLACEAIEDLIHATKNLNTDYWLYTNGLVLDTTPKNILSAMQLILVSVDGDKDAQDKYRGSGTYKVITQNIANIRKKISTPVLGRITVEETTDLYKSTTTLLKLVDYIYWQIVNKPSFDDPIGFARRYKRGLKKLFDLWLDSLQQGNNLSLIPFQAITETLLNGKNNSNNSFRCGCGTDYQAIDLDGTIYDCDEYVGTSFGRLGNINDKLPLSLNYESHKDIYDNCIKCTYSDICLGRCKKMLKTFGRQQIQIYCELTKYLIKLVNDNLENIRYAMQSNGIKSIYTSPCGTEELP